MHIYIIFVFDYKFINNLICFKYKNFNQFNHKSNFKLEFLIIILI